MKNNFLFLVLFLFGLAVSMLSAQSDDDFGFGFDDEEGGGGSFGGGPVSGARIGGKVTAGITVFPDDFTAKGEESAGDRIKQVRLYDIFSGEINFSAGSSNADGVINLKVKPNFEEPTQILSLDEAYIRAFYGKLTVEGGLRKLTWGRADSFGPLDVINPLDYSDITNMADFPSIKIARPMLHASYGIGPFTKIEGVFLPWFEGARFAEKGRWAPAQVSELAAALENRMTAELADYPAIAGMMADNPGAFTTPAISRSDLVPDTKGLEYFQGGFRFATTVGPADFGLQYYSGFNNRPSAALSKNGYQAARKAMGDLDNALTELALKEQAFNGAQQAFQQASINYSTLTALAAVDSKYKPEADQAAAELQTAQGALSKAGEQYQTAGANTQTAQAALSGALNPSALVAAAYNRYHQIGVDYGQVLFGFNTRAELAANITGDLAGDDGLVYNPALVWSLGFDRDIPAVKINVNLQVNESIRLFHDKLGGPLFDIEAGKDLTSTRMTLRLSRFFFQDELELQATAIWGIEDRDCYLIPAITWTKGDVALAVSLGIFAGSKDGELGQYRDNYYVKTLLSYSF
jgi:hypothetical protein